MTYSLTDVQIANMALSSIGSNDTVTSVSSATAGVDLLVSTWYEHARRTVLNRYDWPFARKRIKLGKAEVPAPVDFESGDYLASIDSSALEIAGRWTYRYRYPDDCVKFHRIQTPTADQFGAFIGSSPRREKATPYEVRQQSVLDTVNSKKINSLTKASPGVVTTNTAHGFSVGDVIFITGIKDYVEANSTTDMVEADGRLYSVGTVTDTKTFSLKHVVAGSSFDTSGYTTYNTTTKAGRVVALLQGVKTILTDLDDAVGFYTKYETDPTLYPPSFVDTLVRHLATCFQAGGAGKILTPQQRYQMDQVEDERDAGRALQEGYGGEAREADWVSGR